MRLSSCSFPRRSNRRATRNPARRLSAPGFCFARHAKLIDTREERGGWCYFFALASRERRGYIVIKEPRAPETSAFYLALYAAILHAKKRLSHISEISGRLMRTWLKGQFRFSIMAKNSLSHSSNAFAVRYKCIS